METIITKDGHGKRAMSSSETVSRKSLFTIGANNDDECFPALRDYRAKNPKHLIISFINVNSLRYKFIEIEEILNKNYSDFLAIAETKLDSSFPNRQFNVKDIICIDWTGMPLAGVSSALSDHVYLIEFAKIWLLTCMASKV